MAERAERTANHLLFLKLCVLFCLAFLLYTVFLSSPMNHGPKETSTPGFWNQNPIVPTTRRSACELPIGKLLDGDVRERIL